MSEPQEREDLEQLLSSPGWERFRRFAKAQYGPEGYGVRVKQAIREASAKNADIVAAVAKVDAANDALNELLTWPYERMKQLQEAEAQRKALQQVPLSRRGNL